MLSPCIVESRPGQQGNGRGIFDYALKRATSLAIDVLEGEELLNVWVGPHEKQRSADD